MRTKIKRSMNTDVEKKSKKQEVGKKALMIITEKVK